jgi:L-idonate 5-dehydrogenase
VPLNAIVAKELHIHGTQRFHEEFATAVALISSRAIDVRPIISHSLPLAQADAAFLLAGDRSAACKVQLTF